MKSLTVPSLLGAAAALAALCGCSMEPSISAKVPIAGGQVIEVPLDTGIHPVTDGVVSVNNFQFAPWAVDKAKKDIAFTFVVGFVPGAEPSSILVEDVSEDPIVEIFRDDNAHIVKEHLWGAVTRPFPPDDDKVKWVLNLDNNVRVYRFTVKLKDGTTHVLLRPMFVPGQMKAFIRSQLGISS